MRKKYKIIFTLLVFCSLLILFGHLMPTKKPRYCEAFDKWISIKYYFSSTIFFTCLKSPACIE